MDFVNYHIVYGIVSIISYGFLNIGIEFLMVQFEMQVIKVSIRYADIQVQKL